MEKNDSAHYLDRLRNSTEERITDLYSLKEELMKLDKSSKVFDDFERESMSFDKDTLKQVEDLSLLIKIRNLASEIKNKKQINSKLHSLHFNLNLLKNSSSPNVSSVKNAVKIFLHDKNTKFENIINELNDFKIKLKEMERHHLNLLPKSLDNKLMIDEKYTKHINKLHSIHKKQKSALISTIRLFLQLTMKHIKACKNLNKKLKSNK